MNKTALLKLTFIISYSLFVLAAFVAWSQPKTNQAEQQARAETVEIEYTLETHQRY